MLSTTRPPVNPKKSLIRKIVLYVALFITLWSILMFVVIPWESSGEIPPDSFELIEGQRAYAMILREKRPTLATSIRGLNMAGTEFSNEKTEDGRQLIFGNVRINYDNHGEFISIQIVKNAE